MANEMVANRLGGQALGEGIDLEAIARRMMEVAEMGVREHLTSLRGSQADGLLDWVDALETETRRESWR